MTAPVGDRVDFTSPLSATPSRDDFASGVLDALRQLLAMLIGRGVIEASDAEAAMKMLAAFWDEKGRAQRAEPARILSDALAGMGKIKREADANIFSAPKEIN
jgi:hypothetical protein